jgi:DNA-binding response OmpR family regulator
LLEKVWGYEEQITTRTVDNFIARIRQKVEPNPNQPRVILTVHGSGYKMVV